jgi:hypothetical protein
MKLPLYRKVVLHTCLTPAECIKKIQENTSPASNFSFFKGDPKNCFFTGKVYPGGFVVRKVIDYSNSFVPLAHGTVKPLESGAEVAIVFKPHKVVTVFSVIWLAGMLLGTMAIAVACIYNGEFEKEALILPAMMVVVCAVIFTAFNAEFEGSKKLIADVLKSPEKE